MRHRLLTLSLLTFTISALGQSSDTIKIKLVAGQEVIRGANLVVKDHLPIIGTATDLEGLATLTIPSNKELVDISFIGPYIRLKTKRSTDSIYFDINSKKATFYLNKKKMRTRKQVVSGYWLVLYHLKDYSLFNVVAGLILAIVSVR